MEITHAIKNSLARCASMFSHDYFSSLARLAKSCSDATVIPKPVIQIAAPAVVCVITNLYTALHTSHDREFEALYVYKALCDIHHRQYSHYGK